MMLSAAEGYLLEEAARRFGEQYPTKPIVYRDPVRTHLARAFVDANQAAHRFTGAVWLRHLENDAGCVIGVETASDNDRIRQSVESLMSDLTV